MVLLCSCSSFLARRRPLSKVGCRRIGGSGSSTIAGGSPASQDVIVVATRALEVLAASGTAHQVHEYTHDPAAPYGLEAAQALGADPARVLKTLVVDHAGGLAVAVIPVSGELDLKAMADALGAKKVALTDRRRGRTSDRICGRGDQPARAEATACDHRRRERLALADCLR